MPNLRPTPENPLRRAKPQTIHNAYRAARLTLYSERFTARFTSAPNLDSSKIGPTASVISEPVAVMGTVERPSLQVWVNAGGGWYGVRLLTL